LLHVSTLSSHLQASAVIKTEKYEKRALPHYREIPVIFIVHTYIVKLNVFQASIRFKLSVQISLILVKSSIVVVSKRLVIFTLD